MKVLISGNKGFVGEETKRYLRKEGIDFIGFDLMDGYDVRDYEQFLKVCEEAKPDRILHLAAIARFTDADDNPELALETNVLGTRNVSEVASKLHIPLIYSSTGSVYMPIEGEPPITENFRCRGNSVYGCTKYQGEIYVRKHNPYIILRYAHLYGKEKRMYGLIGGFADRIQRGLQPELYGGKQSSDFTYIKDIAQANYLALIASWDKWNQSYNIGTGEEITAEQAGKMVCDLLGYKGEIKISEPRGVDAKRFVFDISKARKMLGYEPRYSFERGLKETFK